MFENIEPRKPDPILGLSVAYKNDSNPHKIDLGVGVFKDSQGNTPIMAAVKQAEAQLIASENTKVYTPPQGYAGLVEGVRRLIFSAESDALANDRIQGVQTPGGCGALRLGAELLALRGAKTVYIGTPTWGNHVPLLSSAGLHIKDIPYYDTKHSTILFDQFCDSLRKFGPEDVVLFHGACHNPTGADMTDAQWDQIIDIIAERGFLPFIDTAYHGFADGLETDVSFIRKLSETVPEMMVSYSCSKNFGLYRERIGAIFVMGQSADQALAAKTHLEYIARTNYSMPPAHGGALVSTILASEELTQKWQRELAFMREDVKNKRKMLRDYAHQNGLGDVFDFLPKQNGMFSLLPISPEQAHALVQDHSIYLTSNGRVNICGFSADNIVTFCKAYKSVM